MRLVYLHIHNFRSIADLEIACQLLVVFIGPNNHGKSNILAAIEFLLSTSQKPVPDDFFAFRSPEDKELWVEALFSDLTEQEKKTFEKYVRADGSVKIRKTASLSDAGDVDVSYRGYRSEPTEWWLTTEGVDRLTQRDEVEKLAESLPDLKELLKEKGRLTKQRIQDFQEAYINEHSGELRFEEKLESGPLLGTKNVGGGVLPDFYLVPAVRDLSEETKVRGTTTFGRLISRAIQEMAARDPRFLEIQSKIKELIQALNVGQGDENPRLAQLAAIESSLASELGPWGVAVSIEVTPPEIEKIFELGTELHLDDGLKTIAERKGHGLQRAVIFALLRAWAKVLRSTQGGEDQVAPRKASTSLIFAIEEPELFLHPHAQRRLAEAIDQLANTTDHQVFLCTHSTHFINLDNYRSIVIVTKDNVQNGSLVRQCTGELFQGGDLQERKNQFNLAAWINPDRGEMFFARRVVFVEGQTEKVLLPYVARKLGCFDSNVSIIDCGGKHNLPLYVTLAEAFKLDYLVIHDEDPVPPGVTGEEKAAAERTFRLNEVLKSLVGTPLGSIETVKPNFEAVSLVSKSQGDKKGKPLAALDHYREKPVEDIPERVKELVAAAFRGNVSTGS